MNTNIKNNKMGLGLNDSNKRYMIKYNTSDMNVFKVEKTYLPNGRSVRLQFKTIANLTEYLYNDGFEGFNELSLVECPQMLVNTFNNKGMVL